MEEVIAGRPSMPGRGLSDSVYRRVGWEATLESPLRFTRKYYGSPGGRVQVYGCGPGCLVVSLLLSIGLTILVNVLIRLF
jgi:hypothetical protein